MTTKPQSVFLAIPCGASQEISGLTVRAIARSNASEREVSISVKGSSILPFTFNDLWCEALNGRKSPGFERFVMLHNDIVPNHEEWIDQLLDLMTEYGADVMSVVSPIKDEAGLTSTGVDTHPWRPRRLTMNEVLNELPPVFGNAELQPYGGNLLFNTGLMAVRLDTTWAEEVTFGFGNAIAKLPNGVYLPLVEPEDWRFSRWCHKRDLACFATSKISLGHIGLKMYPNNVAWGHQHDKTNRPQDGWPNEAKE